MTKKKAQGTQEQRQAAFTTAVVAQIEAITSEGITPASLRMLAHFCESMANALTLFEDPNALIRSRFGNALGDGIVGANSNVAYYAPSDPILPSSPAENFGTKSIRELVGAAKEIMQAQARPKVSMTDLIYAVSQAKQSGMDKLAAKLEKKVEAMLDGEDHRHEHETPKLLDNKASANSPPPRKRVRAANGASVMVETGGEL